MYFIAPSPDISGKEETYATWENGFSESEIARIITIGENLKLSDGTIQGNVIDSNIRSSDVAWIDNNQDTTWLYDKLGFITRQLNGQFFQFDLSGFAEPFQYTTYKNSGDHYDWHCDKGAWSNVPRKLSLVLQLSAADEYEGGELQLMTGGASVISVERRKGLIVAFPSWILHRVTPVTSGTRLSLVVWVGGNKFR